MSLTSQLDSHEKLMVALVGKPVVVQVPTSKTIDFTTARGDITRDMYEQSVLAVPGEEKQEPEGLSREFRCLVSDLPSIPLTELVVVHDGHRYQVQSFTQSESGCSVILTTTRA